MSSKKSITINITHRREWIVEEKMHRYMDSIRKTHTHFFHVFLTLSETHEDLTHPLFSTFCGDFLNQKHSQFPFVCSKTKKARDARQKYKMS